MKEQNDASDSFNYDKEYNDELLAFWEIGIPDWKRLVVQLVCRFLNVKYVPESPFHLNIKGSGNYDIVNGRMVKKSISS